MATIITIDEQGSVTLPDNVRRRLRLRGRAFLAAELWDDGVLLRPVTPPAESAESAPLEGEGQAVRNMSRAYLLELIRRADSGNVAGRDVTPDEITSWLEEGEAKGLLRRVPAAQ